MLRINVVSVVTGFVFVVFAAFLRYWYVLHKLGLSLKFSHNPEGIDSRLLWQHPLLYGVIVFFVGLYMGGRIFR